MSRTSASFGASALALGALLFVLTSLAHCDTPGVTPHCDAGDASDCFPADAAQPVNFYGSDGGR